MHLTASKDDRVAGRFEYKKVVGGPGFEPGASRSRTVLVVCPRVSRRLRRCPPELKLPLLGVPPCPPRAAWCRESVPRLCPGACFKRRGPSTTSNSEVSLTAVRVDRFCLEDLAHVSRRSVRSLRETASPKQGGCLRLPPFPRRYCGGVRSRRAVSSRGPRRIRHRRARYRTFLDLDRSD